MEANEEKTERTLLRTRVQCFITNSIAYQPTTRPKSANDYADGGARREDDTKYQNKIDPIKIKTDLIPETQN